MMLVEKRKDKYLNSLTYLKDEEQPLYLVLCHLHINCELDVVDEKGGMYIYTELIYNILVGEEQ